MDVRMRYGGPPPTLLAVLHRPSLAGELLARCDCGTLGALRLTCRTALQAVRAHSTAAHWYLCPTIEFAAPATAAAASDAAAGTTTTNDGAQPREAQQPDGQQNDDSSQQLAPQRRTPQPLPPQADFRGPMQCPQLQQLSAFRAGIGRASASVLANAEWPCLLRLDLEGNMFAQTNSCAALAQAALPRLRRIDLTNNGITDEGCHALSHASWPSLLTINLSANPAIGPSGTASLARAAWPALRRLLMRDCSAGCAGAAALAAASPRFPALRSLDLSRNKLAAPGVRALAGTTWSSLRLLALAGDCVGDEGAAAIAAAAGRAWPCLEELDLLNTSVGDRGMSQLALASWSLTLQVMHLMQECNLVTPLGLAVLRQAGWETSGWSHRPPVGGPRREGLVPAARIAQLAAGQPPFPAQLGAFAPPF